MQEDPTLAQLESTYFASGAGAATVFSGDSDVDPIRDGIEYFKQLKAEIDQTSGAGDAIYFLVWRIDASMDLLNKQPGDSGYQQLGDLLATKAQAGVDVRVIVSAHVSRVPTVVPDVDFHQF